MTLDPCICKMKGICTVKKSRMSLGTRAIAQYFPCYSTVFYVL